MQDPKFDSWHQKLFFCQLLISHSRTFWRQLQRRQETRLTAPSLPVLPSCLCIERTQDVYFPSTKPATLGKKEKEKGKQKGKKAGRQEGSENKMKRKRKRRKVYKGQSLKFTSVDFSIASRWQALLQGNNFAAWIKRSGKFLTLNIGLASKLNKIFCGYFPRN